MDRSDSIFVDTSGFIAFFDVKDQWHTDAKSYYSKITKARLQVVTNLVIAETYTHLLYRAGNQIALKFLKAAKEASRRAFLSIIYSNEDLEEKAGEFLEKYQDQQLSYVDAVSFAVMTQSKPPIEMVFAFDRHFYLIERIVVPGPMGEPSR